MTHDTARTRLEPADRRRELLAVAEEIASTDGLAGLSTPTVARAAGASKALVFHYFGSVVGLQRAVTTLAVTDLLAAIHVPDGTATQDRPVAILDAFITAVTARRQIWTDIWRGALHDDPETQAILDGARSTLVERLVQHSSDLTGEHPEAVTEAERALLSQGWVALVEHMTATWLGGSELSQERLRDLLVGSLHAVLGSAPR